jgi:hypothetical protein
VATNPARLRARAVVGATVVLVLVVVGYGAYAVRQILYPGPAAPPPPGCQAGTGLQAILLDPGQAANAAIIAGVAARRRLPRQAVTIAYAAALQESKLENLDYGDRDSVGIFQQRPSQGWGPAADLEDPVYASTKFFAALTQVPGYAKLPVYQAAQDVQRSADGNAYAQWTDMAGLLSGYFTGRSPGGVTCWYTPGGKADLAGALRRLAETFGPQGRTGVVARITVGRSGHGTASEAVLQVRPAAGWQVAGWLVANAQGYGLRQVRYAGYVWKAADGSAGWARDPAPSGSAAPAGKNSPPRGSIVAG